MLDQSQQQHPCVICNQTHEQMLMLACIHDPCINCAANQYMQSHPNNSKAYICSKCGDQTQLDKSSIAELTKVYNQNRRKFRAPSAKGIISSPSKNRLSAIDQKSAKFNPQPQRTQNYHRKNRQEIVPTQVEKKSYHKPISQPSYTSNPKKYQVEYPCRDHPQEELTYFCFTCTQPICPECAIHGLHKEHQVQTTRKAIKQIKSQLSQSKQKLQSEVSSLMKRKEKNRKENKQLAQENKHDQDYIRKKLTHLKNIIVEKEKQLLKASEANFQRNCGKTRQQDQLIDKQIGQISSLNRSIESTLKKDDLAILQEYNKRDQQMVELYEKIQADKEQISQYGADNPYRKLNLHLLDKEMQQIIQDLYSIKISTQLGQQND